MTVTFVHLPFHGIGTLHRVQWPILLQVFPLQEPAFKWADANGAENLR